MQLCRTSMITDTYTGMYHLFTQCVALPIWGMRLYWYALADAHRRPFPPSLRPILYAHPSYYQLLELVVTGVANATLTSLNPSLSGMNPLSIASNTSIPIESILSHECGIGNNLN